MSKTRNIILLVSIIIIVFSSIFILYETLFDGTTINPVYKYNMPKVNATLTPPTVNFSSISQTIQGAYDMKTDKTSYKAGDTIYGIWSGCKYRDITATVQIAFVNDIAQTIPSRPGNLTALGCYTNVKVPLTIDPDEFRDSFPGAKYRLYIYTTGNPNPFRTISYTFITNEFTVN